MISTETSIIIAVLVFVASVVVWQARWPQALFDWLGMAAMAYLLWSAAGTLSRWDLASAALLLSACVSRAELHRNGVPMPRMWWRDG